MTLPDPTWSSRRPVAARALVVLLLVVLAALPAAPAAAEAVAVPAAGWGWPLAAAGGPPSVLRGFTAPAQRWSPGHRGVDLAADVGAPVLAPVDGVVVFAGRVVDRDVVSVLGPGGLRAQGVGAHRVFVPVREVVLARARSGVSGAADASTQRSDQECSSGRAAAVPGPRHAPGARVMTCDNQWP